MRLLLAALMLPLAAHAGPAIHAGTTHVLAVNDEGEVFAWGANERSQLGRAQVRQVLAPQQVPGLSFIVAVAVADDFVYGMTIDGKVNRWGGPLFQPRLMRFGDIHAIAAAAQYVVAVERDGSVWARGSSPHNLFGDGTTTHAATAVRVPGLSDIFAVAAGERHALALKRDGTVWSWGANDSGELGDGTRNPRARPAMVPGLSDVVAIAAGRASYAVTRDGGVWAWGANENGDLGDAGTAPRLAPARILGIPAIRSLASGGAFILAVTADGGVWSWGRGDGIERGAAAGALRLPEPVPGLASVVQVAPGRAHALALHSDGRVSAWGSGIHGALGLGGEVSIGRPAFVPSLPRIIAIAAGGDSSFAVDEHQRVHGWGGNLLNQLAVDRFHFASAAQDVPGITQAAAVGAGEGFSVALRRDGRVWAWGANDAGQLGDGAGGDRPLPRQVPLPPRATAIAVSRDTVLALGDDGTVWLWGDGGSPRAIAGLVNVVAIAAGDRHGLALRSDGTVWSFDGASAAPVQLPGLAGLVAIAAGGDRSYAIAADGTLHSWTTQSPDPVRIVIEPVRAVSTSPAREGWHTLALLHDGTVRAWGDNAGGQLGSGDRITRPRPQPVAGLADVVQVTAGRAFSIALLRGGGAASWGLNDAVLGDGTFADRLAPAAVLGIREVNLLDLTPHDPPGVPPELLPSLSLVAASAEGKQAPVLSFEAALDARGEDVGRQASVFVFALAPANVVSGATADPGLPLRMKARHHGKDTALECVLAQLTASGHLVAVSVANLQAYITGVLAAQSQAVNIINGVPAANIGGATFFVGYGTSAGAMINAGTNRGVVSVPGPFQCRPEAPQAGWWWNPAEDGRGFSIEKRGNRLFFAAFLYDVSGRSTWLVSNGPVSLDGSLYSGELLGARGGQTLFGSYPGLPTLRSEGAITLAFNTATNGTLVWPGGAVPLQRFDIVPSGTTLPAAANQPESGWWWNEQEAGRGFFMEWQGGTLDIAGYMYDEAGNPVWYLTVGPMSGDGRSFSGSWWSYAHGRRVSSAVAPVTIEFSGPETALMTLPNGRTTSLTRQRF